MINEDKPLSENIKGKDYLRKLGADRTIILTEILR
jgi:hypothetical protein